MADPRGGVRAVLRKYSPGILLVLAWVAAPMFRARWYDGLQHWLEDAVYRVFSGFPALANSVERLRDLLFWDGEASYAGTLFLATLAVPLALVVRMVARARLRAGHSDPLDRVRRFVATHPRWASAATAGLAALMQGAWLHLIPGDFLRFHPFACSAAITIVGVAQWRIAAVGLRAALASTIESAIEQGSIDADEIRFSAVAVTRETLGMVGGLATLTLAAVAWMATMDIQRMYRDPRLFTAMLAYVGIAALSALAFRQASRISVGVDGVRVGGTSRTRFFAYRDLDEVREERGDVLLVRRGRTLLRLQLHGPDATRRDAIVERIRAGIVRVAEVERDGASNLVKATSPDTVARSMRGGMDYRVASVSRDGLWALVEGSAVDAEARTAAARAILETGTDEERSRVRVAAGHCADPQVRVALEELADEEPASAPGLQRQLTGLPSGAPRR